jgi:hypothetical protein
VQKIGKAVPIDDSRIDANEIKTPLVSGLDLGNLAWMIRVCLVAIQDKNG